MTQREKNPLYLSKRINREAEKRRWELQFFWVQVCRFDFCFIFLHTKEYMLNAKKLGNLKEAYKRKHIIQSVTTQI